MTPENFMRDLFEPKIKFSLMEDVNGEVDGVNILAKVKGEFFFPDGESRNKRFYPRSVWDNVIKNPEVISKLEKRTMYGTVGHDQELNDKAIREGMISHFMTSIYIDNLGKGIGEALILNTPVGKILNTVLRSGSQLCVSSRADGRFKGQVNGMPAIDPNNFMLIGWDFVMDPGFLKANPQIAEAFNKTVNPETRNGGENMEMQKLVEHITSENHDLKDKNITLTSETSALKEANAALDGENKHLKGELELKKDEIEEMKPYKEMGSPEEIKEALQIAEKAADLLKTYEALGSPQEIKQAFTETNKHVSSLQEKYGTTREIAQVFRMAEKMNERILKVGSISEIEKLAENFQVLMTEAEDVAAETEKQVQMKAAEDLSKEIGWPVEEILDLLKTKTVPEIKAMAVKAEEAFMKKHNISATAVVPVVESRYAKKNDPKVVVVATHDVSESSILNKNRDSEESSVLHRDRISMINEQYTKINN